MIHKLCWALLLLACSILSACSTTQNVGEAPGAAASAATGAVERQLIKTGSQEVKVKKFDEARDGVSKIVADKGGYIENSDTFGQESAVYRIRVPSARLEEAMREIATLGKEEDRRIRATDVTGEVIDLRARLQNAVALRNRLRELAKQAQVMKEIIEIEQELARVQTEIDRLEGRLKSLETQVAFSQLDVTLKRERVLGPLGYLGYGVAWTLEKLFIIE